LDYGNHSNTVFWYPDGPPLFREAKLVQLCTFHALFVLRQPGSLHVHCFSIIKSRMCQVLLHACSFVASHGRPVKQKTEFRRPAQIPRFNYGNCKHLICWCPEGPPLFPASIFVIVMRLPCIDCFATAGTCTFTRAKSEAQLRQCAKCVFKACAANFKWVYQMGSCTGKCTKCV
jgi:hypothetical protein